MEYRFFDGVDFVKFLVWNIRDNVATIAVTKEGRTSFRDFDVFWDSDCGEYFEYGLYLNKIYFENFEVME